MIQDTPRGPLKPLNSEGTSLNSPESCITPMVRLPTPRELVGVGAILAVVLADAMSLLIGFFELFTAILLGLLQSQTGLPISTLLLEIPTIIPNQIAIAQISNVVATVQNLATTLGLTTESAAGIAIISGSLYAITRGYRED